MSIKKSEQTKLKILKAAEMEFSRLGIHGARVDHISEQAGVNKRMLYEYFGNKEQLYKTVLLNLYKKLSQYEGEISNLEMDCEKAIKTIVSKYFKFLSKNPNFVSMIMWENLNNGEYLKQITNSSRIKDNMIQLIHKTVIKGKEQGIFKADADEMQVALSLITFIFSYFSNRHTLSIVLNFDMGEKENIKKRENYVADVILKYLKV